MVTPEKLYAATDDGLDILALHYSEVREAARSKKHFEALSLIHISEHTRH